MSIVSIISLFLVHCGNIDTNKPNDDRSLLSGTIVDSSNTPIKNAKIVLLPDSIIAYTDSNGYYCFDTYWDATQRMFITANGFQSFDSIVVRHTSGCDTLNPIVLKKQKNYILTFLDKVPYEVENNSICTVHIKLSLVTSTDTIPVVGVEIEKESCPEIKSKDSLMITDSTGLATTDYYINNSSTIQSCFTFLFAYQNASGHITFCVKNQ